MNKTKNAVTRGELLKWLVKTVLVAGLLTFSGNVSEYRSYNAEPTKTELSEGKSVSSKKAVYFKMIFDGYNNTCFYASSQVEKYTSYLIHQKSCISVKLKYIFKDRPANDQDMGFLLYQSSHRSDEFDMNQPRG